MRPHEDLLISSEDISAMFYVIGLGKQWRPYLAFGKEIPDSLKPPADPRTYALTSRVLPMGFVNSVAVAQHLHREIINRALNSVGPGGECEMRRDALCPFMQPQDIGCIWIISTSLKRLMLAQQRP